jgi:hypothetical protein
LATVEEDVGGITDGGHSTAAISFRRVLTVFHRLFEAHFLPTHFALILTTIGIVQLVYPVFLMPSVLRVTLNLCSWCRSAGFAVMLCLFYRYEQYHRLCVGLRTEEMRRGNLLEEMLEDDSITPNVFLAGGLFEAALFPVGGFLFGVIPTLQATISHIFTERLTYVVSLKPRSAQQWIEDT